MLKQGGINTISIQPPGIAHATACQNGRRDDVMVHKVFKFFFVLHYFFVFFFFHMYYVSLSRLLLKYLLSAIHSQNQMTSCLLLLWMAQNIALYLFSSKLSLIKKNKVVE